MLVANIAEAYHLSITNTKENNMKKLVCGAVIWIVCSSFVMAGLDDSAKMAQSADKVTSKVAYADAGGGSPNYCEQPEVTWPWQERITK